MDAHDDTSPHTLVITGPGRERLYKRFRRLFWGRGGVTVVVDRRVAERRQDASQTAVERRSHERRKAPPDWVVPPP